MTDQRPHKRRRGARVVVRCRGRVLLMADSDPGVPGSGWWVTPGGGIDAGEPSRRAAARELFEETGHRADESALVGPVLRRTAVHGYSDRILEQDEDFYLLEVDQPFEVDTAGFTATEQQRMGGWGWFDAGQTRQMTVWPAQVAELLAWDGEPCRDLGRVEESTVRVEQ